MDHVFQIEKLSEDGWGEWDDEVKDKKIQYMENLINAGHVFKKSDWPGGDDSLPLKVHTSKKKTVRPHKNMLFHGKQSLPLQRHLKISVPTNLRRSQRKGNSYKKQQSTEMLFPCEGQYMLKNYNRRLLTLITHSVSFQTALLARKAS